MDTSKIYTIFEYEFCRGTLTPEHLFEIYKIMKWNMWMIHKLSDLRKLQCVQVCVSLEIRQKNKPFLYQIVTYDEKHIIYDNRKRLSQ